MAAQSSDAANATVSFSQKLNKMIAGGSIDYNSWRSLILEIEAASPEDINAISLAYDSFLSVFPLCHWHLEKYACHKAKLCSPQEAVNIYERGVGVAMFSVGFWVDYFTFGAAHYGNPEDVRRLFRRAISFVDKDYFCYVLWDKYLKYEFNQDGWSFLAQSYIQALRFPTKKLQFYYDNFKQFVANLEEEMGYEKNNSIVEQVSVPGAAIELSKNEISLVIKDLLDSSDRSVKSKALDTYRSIGEEFYQEARQMDEKIKCFEKKIRRRYFLATPLDDGQLNNWHLYLDFMEKQDNMDWSMKLYERCLIPCASYPEFWMRYVEFLESKGGRELAMSALDRATQIFLKNVPEIHLFNVRFKEHVGDVNGARDALILCDTKTDSSLIDNVVTLANLERRLGNFAAASATYKKALKKAREKRKIHVLPSLYSHFAQLTFLTTGSAAAARDVLIEGVRHVPHCRFLLEELIKFAMTHEGASQVNIIDPIIADAISPGLNEYEGLNAKDREDISYLFLEFVNLCGTIHDIRKAWNRHIKLFPQFLRMRTTYKHSTSDNHLIDSDRNKKRNYNQPEQEQALEFPRNHEIHPNHVLKKLSPRKPHDNNSNETVQLLSTKAAVVLSNEDASPDYELSCQSKEDKPEPMVLSAELVDQAKESVGLAKQYPYESANEVGKSIETTDSIEVSVSLDKRDLPESQTIVSQQVHNEIERDGSVSRQHSTPTNINTNEDSIEIDHTVQGHAQNQENNALDDKTRTQNLARQNYTETDQDGPTSTMTPSITMSEGLTQPSSYTQENMNQITSLSTQQSLAMSQMLYHYHQQQLLQHQYQQQFHMQHPYLQLQHNYLNQQPYQLQPHQHNQPHVHQQQYAQQQQIQSSAYQIPSYQQSQQMVGHLQLQQGQETQDLAYQAQHLAYQQYQQYQGYHQHLQHQQQTNEGPIHMQEQYVHHPEHKQQDEILQQHQKVESKQNSTQNTNQNQQVSKKAPPEYDATAEYSESRHLRVQSPQVLQ